VPLFLDYKTTVFPDEVLFFTLLVPMEIGMNTEELQNLQLYPT